MILTLSKPPPTMNTGTTVSRGRKIKSSEYRSWLASASWELAAQPGKFETIFWSIDIKIPGKSTKADLDNLSKGIIDALGQAGKTPDDRYLVGLRTSFYEGEKVTITLIKEDSELWAKTKGMTKRTLNKLQKRL